MHSPLFISFVAATLIPKTHHLHHLHQAFIFIPLSLLLQPNQASLSHFPLQFVFLLPLKAQTPSRPAFSLARRRRELGHPSSAVVVQVRRCSRRKKAPSDEPQPFALCFLTSLIFVLHLHSFSFFRRTHGR